MRLKLEDIPQDIIEDFASIGFFPKGKNGSFYKKTDDGFTFRISTHKPIEKLNRGRIVLTMFYEKVEDLKNLKITKFAKMKAKKIKELRKIAEAKKENKGSETKEAAKKQKNINNKYANC